MWERRKGEEGMRMNRVLEGGNMGDVIGGVGMVMGVVREFMDDGDELGGEGFLWWCGVRGLWGGGGRRGGGG